MLTLRFVRPLSVLAASVLGATACSNVLDVDFPGRVPAEQIDDPSLAPVLVKGVIGDLECAYNNYVAATAAHGDEFETANSNGTGAAWGERGITSDFEDYISGPCEGTFTGFGIQTVMHTARFQAEDIYNRLQAWTDQQVPNRRKFLATVRTYGAYPYIFFGETYCEIAFDGGSAVSRAASLTIAEQRLTEAITLAQAAGDNDILNLARVGMARVRMNQQKWPEAAQVAALVSSGYVKLADRGTENDRRYNKFYGNFTAGGLYVVADELRTINDPRLRVRDGGRGAFNPTIRLWVTDKYGSLGDPIILASYREAQLILAEAQARQGQIGQALGILNARRGQLGLSPVTATTQAAAIAAVIEERRRELAFEGGHRLNDILRNNIPWKGANGSTRRFNDYTGRPYGAATCFPLPTKEVSGV
ncbi:MAG: RagB/SusD family nutrient uptake outer membrane protein [Gemmatimonadetes bacterium]|nr:RagB/SusD family nutrient uptake outer membrane protein [Gemmatimonadota bacterium]